MNNAIDIKNLLDNSTIDVKFQPIVSVIRKSVIGLAGTSMGADLYGHFFPANELFDCAEKNDSEIDLDRLIRKNIIEKFNNICTDDEKLLFISINMAVISKFVGSGIILDLINKSNINPQNVVLEIFENNIDDVDILQQFINSYRSRGFLVALTIGSGFANLDKISQVEPDIIKISESITKDIELNFYKQEVFKSLVNLSKKISALVVADGINVEGQAITSLELGAEMLQGDYFGEYKNIKGNFLNSVKEKVNYIASQYKKHKTEQIEFEKSNHKRYDECLNNIITSLSTTKENEFDDKLTEFINKYDFFECAYVLDNCGVQVSDTITRFKTIFSQKAFIFKPAKKGTDHSLKKYYYFLDNMGLNKYVTDAYISLASGNLCITISEKFKGVDNKNYILCIDLNPNYINL
ncbi:EAL domain-containing protein [Clostridiaceae bacterium UIB06]|uniref:EAL domain-containing protein n=1 Tax=Clostridium thailandense TaxID=2794346 RepID=A0A949U1X6_9CLOT|nr:EAL domain-containing protein [Clostridium thailandense]MBV7274814.1 EAL domain-containing protein [Clostridium thailandense]MCH5137275.1 EAL domain-containing protein [Clostridiaceae bacterium UIB06]